jgi:hypothetical protein
VDKIGRVSRKLVALDARLATEPDAIRTSTMGTSGAEGGAHDRRITRASVLYRQRESFRSLIVHRREGDPQ